MLPRVAVCLVACSPALVFAQSDDLRYDPVTVLRQPVRPIVDPDIASAAEADLDDNELVIGVEIGGNARAYPINQLTGPSREIINDELSGSAIAATW